MAVLYEFLANLHQLIIPAYDYFAIMLFQIRQECDMKLSTIWQQLLHLQGQCQAFYNWVNFKINKTTFLSEGLSSLYDQFQLDSSFKLNFRQFEQRASSTQPGFTR